MAIQLHLQLLPRLELFFTTSQPNWLLITSRQRQGVVLPVLMIFDVYYLHGLPSTAPILALRASLASKLQRWRKVMWCRYQLDTVKQCRVCGLIFFAEHNPIFLHVVLLSKTLKCCWCSKDWLATVVVSCSRLSPIYSDLTAVASLQRPMCGRFMGCTPGAFSRHFLVAGEMRRQDPKIGNLGWNPKRWGGKVWQSLLDLLYPHLLPQQLSCFGHFLIPCFAA